MKTNRDPERDEPLLDAILRDERWEASDAACKAQAMGAFQTHQRVRRVIRLAGGMSLLAIALAAAIHFSRPLPNVPAQAALAPPEAVPSPVAESKEPKSSRFLTDEQLLASFPEGSCFIAEIDGRKELIFLDPALERIYVAGPKSRAN